MKSEKINKPWEAIMQPKVNDSPIAPKKKRIVGLSIILGMLTGLTASIFKEKKQGIVYNLSYLKRLLPYPHFDGIKLDSNENLDCFVELLVENQISKINSLGLIVLGDINKNLLDSFILKLRKTLKNKDLIVSNNLLETKNCSSLLLITSLGLVKKSKIELISSQLELNKKDICGTIIAS